MCLLCQKAKTEKKYCFSHYSYSSVHSGPQISFWFPWMTHKLWIGGQNLNTCNFEWWCIIEKFWSACQPIAISFSRNHSFPLPFLSLLIVVWSTMSEPISYKLLSWSRNHVKSKPWMRNLKQKMLIFRKERAADSPRAHGEPWKTESL